MQGDDLPVPAAHDANQCRVAGLLSQCVRLEWNRRSATSGTTSPRPLEIALGRGTLDRHRMGQDEGDFEAVVALRWGLRGRRLAWRGSGRDPRQTGGVDDELAARQTGRMLDAC